MTTEQPSTTTGGKRPPAGLSRSLAFERAATSAMGVIALATGVLALLVGSGVLGTYRARRPLLDPLAQSWVTGNPGIALTAAAILGIVLVVLGIWWITHALRPETRPNLHLGGGAAGRTSLSGSALSEAVRADAREVTGVVGARVRTTGTPERPGLRMVLSLRDDTDIGRVWDELDHKVLSRARSVLETETLPTVIKLELDRSRGQRVR
ncbi:alkaline shock response membrane anchor protein AmaP [Actinopolyspora halophila]|uniref:alkaline shock response membrane anchor protein AmaP n=1 Tax=Actinopolyspora halophila TaxID=1850 RepID=UPI00035C25EE|nr:alkaline shock response membrane anchor protein AmaP [Actinopolyspora halophila]